MCTPLWRGTMAVCRFLASALYLVSYLRVSASYLSFFAGIFFCVVVFVLFFSLVLLVVFALFLFFCFMLLFELSRCFSNLFLSNRLRTTTGLGTA